MIITGRKSTHELVDISGLGDFVLTGAMAKKGFTSGLFAFKGSIAEKFGGTYDDYFCYKVTFEEEQIVHDGGILEPIWTDDEITGVHFPSEDVKPWIRVSCDKTKIIADKKSKSLLRFEIWKADKSGIDTTFNDTIIIPSDTPVSKGKIEVTITNGIGSKFLTTDISGDWKIPAVKKVCNKTVRVDKDYIVNIESILNLE